MLTREQLLGKTKRRYCTVTLPEGEEVRLQSLSEGEKSNYDSSMLNVKSGGIFRDRLRDAERRLVVLTVVGDDDRPLLSLSDVEALAAVDGRIISLLFNAATKHCGISKDDIEAAVKNSEGISVEDLPSDSLSV